MIIGVAVKFKDKEIRLAKPCRHADCFTKAESHGIDIHDCEKSDDQGFFTHADMTDSNEGNYYV